MESRPRLAHCLHLLETAQNVEGLRTTVSQIRDVYGFAHLVFHVVGLASTSSEHPLLLLTYPEEWIACYFRENYFDVDPVVELSRSAFLPVDWSNLDHKSRKANKFFKQADSFGVGRHGVTIPIRGPQGERSLFTATSNLTEGMWQRQRSDSIVEIQVLSHYLHDRALTLSGLRSARKIRELSPRERQCLELVVRGKLPKQIAPILQISESAVRLYLRSLRRKLGVATTAQAAIRAAALDLIRC